MSKGSDILQYFRLRRIIIPLLIGGIVSFYLIFWNGENGFSKSNLNSISWQASAGIWLFFAAVLLVLRDFGYMIRLRILSHRQLTWKQCFQIVILWEFASAVSPGAVGGTAAALLIMAKEKLSVGKSTSIVLVTSLLDELYYLIMVPIGIFWFRNTTVFPDLNIDWISNQALPLYFWGSYIFLFIWTAFLAFSLLVKPNVSKIIIRFFVSLPVLKRFRKKGLLLADDLIQSSYLLKKESSTFWLKSIAVTFIIWSSRFLIINCLIEMVQNHTLVTHWEIYGKQLIMWILQMTSIFTIGASGFAEILFKKFIGSYAPFESVGPLILIWRMLTYYLYLILGFIILPIWLKRVGLKISLPKKKSG
ncbi:MAG: flippase-like domain-containing protein [Flavobacteriales bacterium]|nr:flippase-like domain-containing protein [Flavobacteriales bacterium]